MKFEMRFLAKDGKTQIQELEFDTYYEAAKYVDHKRREITESLGYDPGITLLALEEPYLKRRRTEDDGGFPS